VTNKIWVASLCTAGIVAIVFVAGGGSSAASSTGAVGAMRASSTIKIAVVCATPQASSVFGPIEKGALAAGKAMGVRVTYTGVGPNNSTPAGLVALITAAVNQHPNALVYCNAWPSAENPIIKRAVKRGIAVFEFLNTPPKQYRGSKGIGPIAWTNGSNYDGGVKAGKMMAAAGVKHPVCVNHTVGNVSVQQRCRGFVKALAAKGIHATTLQLPLSAQNNITAFLNDVKGALLAHSNIDGLFTQGPAQDTAAVQAVREVGRAGKVKIGGFDMSPTVLADIRRGTILFSMWQQPYLAGFVPVMEAALQAKYGMSPQGLVNLGPVVVSKSNVSQLAKAAADGLL
jgi:simple sugar transport system substrate-binding protein